MSPRLSFLMLDEEFKSKLEEVMPSIMEKINDGVEDVEFITLARLESVVNEAVVSSLPRELTRLLDLSIDSRPDGRVYVSIDPRKDIHDISSSSIH